MPIFDNELMGYTQVCRYDDLVEEQGVRVFVNNVEMAVYKVGGKVYAINNLCSHQHAAIMYDGFIEKGYAVCPAHGWKFSLATGRVPSGGKGLDVYPVRVVENFVYVKAEEKEVNWNL